MEAEESREEICRIEAKSSWNTGDSGQSSENYIWDRILRTGTLAETVWRGRDKFGGHWESRNARHTLLVIARCSYTVEPFLSLFLSLTH